MSRSLLRALSAGLVALACAMAVRSAGAQRPVAAGYPLGMLLPDGEFVYGPTLYRWDVGAFVQESGGYLARYSEAVEGEVLTGAQIVARVAEDYSVGARLLLALIEMHGGWVRDPAPAERDFPVGMPQPGLYAGLSAAADELNRYYYGHRYAGQRSVVLADGATADVPETNAATFALVAFLGRGAASQEWAGLAAASRFYGAWTSLFGDAHTFRVGDNLPAALPEQALRLPFGPGEVWYFAAGPHSPWGAGGPRAAVDFAPPPAEAGGCHASVSWVTAVAPGVVVRSRPSGVVVDLDGNDYEGTGWVHVYAHLGPVDRAPVGTRVAAGDGLGHPSCDGGPPTQTRVTFARKFNGEWIPADLPAAPLVLDGWAALPGDAPGAGWFARPGVEPRTAGAAKQAAVNGVAAVGGP